jgi:hypothetical protein
MYPRLIDASQDHCSESAEFDNRLHSTTFKQWVCLGFRLRSKPHVLEPWVESNMIHASSGNCDIGSKSPPIFCIYSKKICDVVVEFSCPEMPHRSKALVKLGYSVDIQQQFQ